MLKNVSDNYSRVSSIHVSRSFVALVGSLFLLALTAGCGGVHVSRVPEGQDVLVYTPRQVAYGLSDPVVGEVDVGVTVPECGDDMFIKCPAKAYDPSDYLGIGGSRLVVVEVAAGRYTPSDVRGQIEANRHDTVKNLFVLTRANVMVQGPKRLRAHVSALLRAMPPPTTALGKIAVPTHEPTIHGPSQPNR